MYAIVSTGNKQYIVKQNDFLKIEKISEEKVGNKILLDNVLFISPNNEKKINIGTPFIKGAKILVEIKDVFRDKKVIVFKMKKRKGYHKTKGHRQNLMMIKILEIITE